MTISAISDELLSRCGLNASERVVLLQLLEKGEASVGLLSKRLGIKRPTIYSALANLENLRIVDKVRRQSVYTFRSIPPREIPKQLLQRAKKEFSEIEEATKNLEGFMDQFPVHKSQHMGGYEIVCVETRKGAEELVDALTQFPYESIFDPKLIAVGDWKRKLKSIAAAQSKYSPKIREIIVAGKEASWYREQISNPNHSLRFLPSSLELLTDITLIQDLVILNSYEEGSEVSLRIRHVGLFSLMKVVFDSLWDRLESDI